jgi:hypothetical protein
MILHSKMAVVPTPARLKALACVGSDNMPLGCHRSYLYHHELCHNTEGLGSDNMPLGCHRSYLYHHELCHNTEGLGFQSMRFHWTITLLPWGWASTWLAATCFVPRTYQSCLPPPLMCVRVCVRVRVCALFTYLSHNALHFSHSHTAPTGQICCRCDPQRHPFQHGNRTAYQCWGVF